MHNYAWLPAFYCCFRGNIFGGNTLWKKYSCPSIKNRFYLKFRKLVLGIRILFCPWSQWSLWNAYFICNYSSYLTFFFFCDKWAHNSSSITTKLSISTFCYWTHTCTLDSKRTSSCYFRDKLFLNGYLHAK